MQVSVDAAVSQVFLYSAEITGDYGGHVGVGRSGQRTLKLIHFRQNLRGYGDRNTRHDLVCYLSNAALVAAIRVGVDQRNGKGLNALILEITQLLADPVFVEGRNYIPASAHSFVGLHGKLQVDKRVRHIPDYESGEAARYEGPFDLQHLPIAFGGNEAHFRALALQDGVGRYGRPVHDLVNLRGIHTSVGADSFDPQEYANRRVLGSGVDLGFVSVARVFVHQQQVSEGPTDIHSQSIGHGVVLQCDRFSAAMCRQTQFTVIFRGKS